MTRTGGYCVDENGHDQELGAAPIGYNALSENSCLEECQRIKKDEFYGVTGCEYNLITRTCVYHTRPVTHGNNDYGFTCWLFHEAGE